MLSYLISLLFAKVYVIHTRCASAIRDIEAFIESYMAHAVPSGLSKKKFLKKVYVTVAVPWGFGMLRISTKTIWHTLCHWYSMQTSS